MLKYDPVSGHLIWINHSARRVTIGDIAGSLNKRFGYICITLESKRYRAHRIAWFLYFGEWPSEEIDHKNLDASDNRISNLRLASRSQNMANIGPHKDNSSGIKGAYLDQKTGRWYSRICKNGKIINLGRFPSAEKAGAAYASAAKNVHGQFARTERHAN